MRKKQSHNPVNFHVSLKVLLKNARGETLGLKMPRGSSMSGYYDLPGGRIDSDELGIPFSKIIQREMKEEIGNNIRFSLKKRPVAISWHIVSSPKFRKKRKIFFVFFEGKYLSGKIKVSNEHKNFKWIKLNRPSLSKFFTKGILEGLKNYLGQNRYQRI